MNFLRKFDRFCALVEKAAVVVLFSALVLLLFFNIICRSLFQISFHNILEFIPTMVLWLALVGASLALREGRHIKIELLLRFCSKKFQRQASRVTASFGMIVMGILFYASLEFIQNEIAIFGPIGGLSIIFALFFALASFRFSMRVIDPNGTTAPAGIPNTPADISGEAQP